MNFIHPPDFKEITNHKRIEKAPLPKRAVLPLFQHVGIPSEPIVKPGDTVVTGQLIAESKGFISSRLHASISGKVISIESAPHPVAGSNKSIIIESDEQDTLAPQVTDRDVSHVSKEGIIEIVKSSGIVGLGGAAFPTFVKLMPPKDKKIDTLVINGAECEPFLTCDHNLMLEKSKEIILGIKVVARTLGVENIILGVEENKLDAIEALGTALFKLKDEGVKLKIEKLKTRYPQGGEKQLIYALLRRVVPSGSFPLDVGCVVSNVQTVFSVYEAVYFGKPLYERVITVSGKFLKEPKNLLVRVGTSIRELLDFCKIDYKSNIHKIVVGGPMTGMAQCNLDAPIIKGTSGILVLDDKYSCEETSCIRCSRCIEACPMGLMPCMIGLGANNNRFDIASSYSPLDCIECGSCSYVCPANIPLVQLIKIAKTKARTK